MSHADAEVTVEIRANRGLLPWFWAVLDGDPLRHQGGTYSGLPYGPHVLLEGFAWSHLGARFAAWRALRRLRHQSRRTVTL